MGREAPARGGPQPWRADPPSSSRKKGGCLAGPLRRVLSAKGTASVGPNPERDEIGEGPFCTRLGLRRTPQRTWRSVRVDTQPEELAEMAQRGTEKRALVIGGGIAGIQAALDLANSRIPVTLVERTSSLGGRMAQLDKTFPTMDCAI
jgi:NADPH-dependent 2,4-dienoyl-CoA reductase/sulfur reductase-like enzyme